MEASLRFAALGSVERNREVVDAGEGHGVSSFVDRNSGLVVVRHKVKRFIGAGVQTPPSTETHRITNIRPRARTVSDVCLHGPGGQNRRDEDVLAGASDSERRRTRP